MRFIKTAIIAASMVFIGATSAFAADYEIVTLDRNEAGEIMVFEPSFLKIEPGDTVTFTPRGNYHNAETIEGMFPEGAEPFIGEIDEPITITFDVPGVYGIACAPHYMMGMVAMIVVGDPVNLEEAKAVEVPAGATGRIEALFAQVEAL